MNIYFLVEGANTEKRFYPAVVQYIFNGGLTKLDRVYEVSDENDGYFLLSGNGYPQIFSILEDTINDINNYPAYNYLFVCLDADEMSIEERKAEFENELNSLKERGVVLHELCEVTLIVQYRCIESWFLGNESFFRRQTSNPIMLNFHHFYNVRVNDPENMGYDENFTNHASYHFSYFKNMALENRTTYSKNNAKVVCNPNYITQLVNRFQSTDHLKSFGFLFSSLQVLNSKLLSR